MINYKDMVSHLPTIASLGERKFNVKTRDDEKVFTYKLICSFALQTSLYDLDELLPVPYVWTLNISGTTFYGRDIEEFKEAVLTLQQFYKLTPFKRLRIYVDKLNVEFQFIKNTLSFRDEFSAKKRDPYYVVFNEGVEFYSAYAMTERSIDDMAYDLGIEYIDDKTPEQLRSSKSDLDADTLKYAENQTDILYELIKYELVDNPSIVKLPMTNTQRVRRHVNGICQTNKTYMDYVRNLKMDKDTFLLSRQCFSGGFAYANPNFKDKILTDVTSLDISSAYPGIISTEFFPSTNFEDRTIKSFSEFMSFVNEPQLFCSMFNITLYDVSPISPGIYFTNDNHYQEDESENVVISNRKVMKADKLTVSLTNVDWSIFVQVYKFDQTRITINRFMTSKARFIDKTLVQPILDMYKDKTKLKNIQESERQYRESKVKLNSVYGMLVTNEVLRDSIKYDSSGWSITESIEADLDANLEAYNEKKGRTMFYPWGVWVTAYARRRLFNIILATKNDFVYCDTDSVKILNYWKYDTLFENDIEIQKSKIDLVIEDIPAYNRSDFAPRTPNGNRKIIGIFEEEYTYSKFKTLRAKQYVGIIGNDLEVTCSGLPKKNLKKFLMSISSNVDEAINNFNNDLVIPPIDTGIYSIHYQDNQRNRTITDYQDNVLDVMIPSSAYFEPRGFSLNPDIEDNKSLDEFLDGKVTTNL